MGNLAANNPERIKRDSAIVAMRLEGKTVREIGAEIGLDNSRICQILNSPEVKAYLDTEVKAIIDQSVIDLATMLPTATKNYNELLKSDNDKIKLEASRDVTKITGVHPTGTVNNFFTQIYQDNSVHGAITPELQGLLSNQLIPVDDDCIDISAEGSDNE